MSSQLKPFSVGIVLVDKEPDSWEVEVKPIETNGFSSGTLSNQPEEQTASGVNADGEAYSETTKSVHGVIATWFPDQPNRISAPDVTAGEQVMLYKFADDDQFYWKTTELSHENRAKETIVVAAANKAKKDKVKLDATNSYFMEMCTRTKQVSLRTNKNDGEPYAYLIQVNTKTGAVIIEDDIGNLIQLDSSENTITITSAAGSEAVFNENISFETKGDIMGKAGGNITWDAGGNINNKAKGPYNVQSASYIIASANVNASAGGIDFKGGLTNNGTNVGSSHVHTELGDGKDVSTPK